MVGRIKEKSLLLEAFRSDLSEFVVVYGRRRVGKTFLIRETFNYTFTFQHTGVLRANLQTQLVYFRDSLVDAGWRDCPVLDNWHDAFRQLQLLLESRPDGRKTVFLDELPYMVTRRSDCLEALDHFWNGWATTRKDILLIVCGSAASWLLDKVILNKGGLHNRVTVRIPLQPFTLAECEQYANEKGLGYGRKQLAECYLALGGIPYYWKPLRRGLSVAQNLDELFFANGAVLKDEFSELYASLFSAPEPYVRIVQALGKIGQGMLRDDLARECGMTSSGTLTKCLSDLERCGFVLKVQAYGKKVRNVFYRLIDNYTLFYLKFASQNVCHDEHFWTSSQETSVRKAWLGLAFERLCFQHVRQIKGALGIAGVKTSVSSWRHHGDEVYPVGAQIDMLIDRADGIVNLCEMKFSDGPYVIDKQEHDALVNRRETFRSVTGCRKGIHLTMITAEGLVHNAYWNDIQAEVVLDDLFKE